MTGLFSLFYQLSQNKKGVQGLLLVYMDLQLPLGYCITISDYLINLVSLNKCFYLSGHKCVGMYFKALFKYFRKL